VVRFAIYGNFVASIGRDFFPREDGVSQLLAVFGVFAIGYLARPIGGAVIGYIGDYYSRRAALNMSVTAMAVPTFLIGLLPGYETLGLLGRSRSFYYARSRDFRSAVSISVRFAARRTNRVETASIGFAPRPVSPCRNPRQRGRMTVVSIRAAIALRRRI
jgi:MFS family permease